MIMTAPFTQVRAYCRRTRTSPSWSGDRADALDRLTCRYPSGTAADLHQPTSRVFPRVPGAPCVCPFRDGPSTARVLILPFARGPPTGSSYPTPNPKRRGRNAAPQCRPAPW